MAPLDAASRSGLGLRLKIALALAAVYVVWGSTYLAIRFAVETLPPLTMAGVRFLLAGGLLYAWSRLRGEPAPRPVHWRSAAVVGALLLLAGNGIVVWAEQWVDSGLTALLVSTTPLWMVLFHWLKQGGARPTLRVWAGILLGFLGVALLVRPSGAGGVHLTAAAALIFASFCWASGSLYSRRAELPSSPLLATGLEMITGGAFLVVAGAALGELGRFHWAAVSLRSGLAFAYLVFVGALVGFTAYSWLLKAAPPALVSTYAYINPLVAVLLGWALAGEKVTGTTLLAALVIVSGVALITIGRPAAPGAQRGALRSAEREPGALDRQPAVREPVLLEVEEEALV